MTEEATLPPKRQKPYVALLSIVALLMSAAALAGVFLPGLREPARADVAQQQALASQLTVLQHQVQALNASQTPEQHIDQRVESRLQQIEQQLMAADVAISEAVAEKSGKSVLGIGSIVAAMRLEQKLLRGDPFAAELEVLKRHVSDAAEISALEYLKDGFPTKAALVTDLKKAERAVRSKERIAAAEGPLQRALATLQGMVLVRDTSTTTDNADVLNQFYAAAEHGAAEQLDAAWTHVPAAAKSLLEKTYNQLLARQKAERAVHSIFNKLLVE